MTLGKPSIVLEDILLNLAGRDELLFNSNLIVFLSQQIE
jgi:hypothetical protein